MSHAHRAMLPGCLAAVPFLMAVETDIFIASPADGEGAEWDCSVILVL